MLKASSLFCLLLISAPVTQEQPQGRAEIPFSNAGIITPEIDGLLGPIRLIAAARSRTSAVHTLRTHSPYPNRSHISGDANGH
jgi:hypothetical protein